MPEFTPNVPLVLRLRVWVLNRVATVMLCEEYLIALSLGSNAHVSGRASVEFKEETATILMRSADRAARRRVTIHK